MQLVSSQSDLNRPGAALQRARGTARVRLCSAPGRTTRVATLFQEGCLKVRLPRPHLPGDVDLAIINTAGGLTGGDIVTTDVALEAGASATVTTPACERIYRSMGGDVRIRQHLRVGRGARLDWVPQETILFDQARLQRRLAVELEADAEVTLAEAVLFGRVAMNETVTSGFFSDFWTVRRDGRLLFADATRITSPFDQAMACPSTLGGHAAMASVVHVGPDLEAKRDALRDRFSQIEDVAAGASLVGDVILVRIVAPVGHALRRALIPALGVLCNPRPLPRAWSC
jgi:urease accessory protein